MSATRWIKCPCCDAELVQEKVRVGWFRFEWKTTKILRTEKEKAMYDYALAWQGWSP
jgi:hypothetical protein